MKTFESMPGTSIVQALRARTGENLDAVPVPPSPLESPDSGRARPRQELMSKEYARSVEETAAGGPAAAAPVAQGGGSTLQNARPVTSTSVLRDLRPNTRRGPLGLPITRTGIPEGATETAKAVPGIATQPVRLVCPGGFQILSITAAGQERLLEPHRAEGVLSDRFAEDAPQEQIVELLDLSPIPANQAIAITLKRIGKESSFEAIYFGLPCEAVATPAPAPAPAPAPDPGPGPGPGPAPASMSPAAPVPIAQPTAAAATKGVAPAGFDPFA